MVLAVHLEIDVERRPARPEIRLPLQLHVAAGDRQRGLRPVLVVEGDRAVRGVHLLQRHVEHPARLRRDRQEDRIGLLPLLAQARQHHRHDRVIALRRAPQHRVEPPRAVEVGRRDELILEAERVEEPPQHRVVMRAEALKLAERVRHAGQRPLQVLPQHRLVRHVLRHLAHAVEIVREADQPRRNVRDRLERPADHRRPRHLAEGADMRQPARPVAGLEQHVPLGRRRRRA